MGRSSSSSRVLGVGATLLVAASLGAGCETCPDLFYKAFEFDISGADPTHTRYTITEQTTGAMPCQDIAAAENCKAGAGVYDMSFVVNGVPIGDLQGVCTLGDQTGCAAEDAEARGPSPLIRIENVAGVWEIALERQGPCP